MGEAKRNNARLGEWYGKPITAGHPDFPKQKPSYCHALHPSGIVCQYNAYDCANVHNHHESRLPDGRLVYWYYDSPKLRYVLPDGEREIIEWVNGEFAAPQLAVPERAEHKTTDVQEQEGTPQGTPVASEYITGVDPAMPGSDQMEVTVHRPNQSPAYRRVNRNARIATMAILGSGVLS
jgi:hypothetical protein